MNLAGKALRRIALEISFEVVLLTTKDLEITITLYDNLGVKVCRESWSRIDKPFF